VYSLMNIIGIHYLLASAIKTFTKSSGVLHVGQWPHGFLITSILFPCASSIFLMYCSWKSITLNVSSSPLWLKYFAEKLLIRTRTDNQILLGEDIAYWTISITYLRYRFHERCGRMMLQLLSAFVCIVPVIDVVADNVRYTDWVGVHVAILREPVSLARSLTLVLLSCPGHLR
jgi:hypothetical protein